MEELREIGSSTENIAGKIKVKNANPRETRNWFEKSGSSKNRRLEKSGLHSVYT